MLGVDDRLITPDTMKWVKVGLIAGLATVPATIALYYVLGMAVDSAYLAWLQNPALNTENFIWSGKDITVQAGNLAVVYLPWLVGLVLLKSALSWLFRTGQFRASSEAKLNVRDQIYKQVVQLGPGILGKRRTGEIANTATEGVEYLDYYFSVYFVQIWIAIAIPFFLCAAIFWIDPIVGWWMLAGVPLTPLFVGSSAKGFRRISGTNEEVKNRNSANYLDSVQGMSTLKMFNQAMRRGKQIQADNEVQRKVTMKLLLVAQVQFVFLELGFALFSTAVAMGVSLFRLSNGFMTPGEAVAVVLLSLEFSRTLLLIGEFFFAGALGREVAANVVKFLDEKSPLKKTGSSRRGSDKDKGISIELQDVTFTYPGADEPAIKNLSMTLQPGETVALIGKSGSGKTTVTNLLLRTLDPDSGRILFDGVPEEELSLEWIREQIGLVPQDPFLFYGTLRDNLLMAKADATEEELMAAMTAAELKEFVDASPDGLDTKVGDQGTALSGGQAQRLAIARAILKDAPIVILDEPTSQIDVETEALLNRALERLCANKTVLLIAHRLSTIEQADRIIVMDNGALAENGTRDELIQQGGIYATMLQTKHAIEDAAAAAG
ncbi:MAG: ATP-binding cassette domain-containing protein [Gammaproteobacteria bacterium]|nr:ATP-binding cassette domain-containing protein [Gammaproteobacteria bacterium]